MLSVQLLVLFLVSLALGLLMGYIYATPKLNHALVVAVKSDLRIMTKLFLRRFNSGVDFDLVRRDVEFASLPREIRRQRSDVKALEIASMLKQRMHQKFGNHITGLYLFGSRARGDHTPNSDVDIIVLFSGSSQERIKASREAIRCANNLLFERGLYIQPRVIDADTMHLADHVQSQLVRTAIDSGILID